MATHDVLYDIFLFGEALKIHYLGTFKVVLDVQVDALHHGKIRRLWVEHILPVRRGRFIGLYDILMVDFIDWCNRLLFVAIRVFSWRTTFRLLIRWKYILTRYWDRWWLGYVVFDAFWTVVLVRIFWWCHLILNLLILFMLTFSLNYLHGISFRIGLPFMFVNAVRPLDLARLLVHVDYLLGRRIFQIQDLTCFIDWYAFVLGHLNQSLPHRIRHLIIFFLWPLLTFVNLCTALFLLSHDWLM